ncbi:MAG: MFS transporter [Deltaproteobacteria bacterium]|nr:MFS transporter [Deltaproteobacteria bacterium]
MPPPRSRFSRDFYLVTAANFVFFLNFASFFLLPLHLKDLGVSERTIGYVMGTAGFAGLCVLPFLGILLDRISRRGFIITGALAMALASFGYVVLPGAGPLIYLLRIVQGVSFTSAFVAASTLAVELAPIGRRGEALGIFGISTLTTHAIAPAFGEVVARAYGFPTLFAVAGSLGLVAVALTLRMRVPDARDRSAATLPARGLPPGATLWLGAATMAACGMGFGAVLTFVPTFVHAIALERVAPFFVSYTAAAVGVRIFLGSLSDRIGRRRVLLPSMILLALAVLALGSVRSMPALVAVGLLFGAGQGMVYPTANAFMVDLSHAGNLGRVQTLFSGSFSVGVAASAFVFGGVIERFGYRIMFAGAAACVALGFVLLWSTRDLSQIGTAPVRDAADDRITFVP